MTRSELFRALVVAVAVLAGFFGYAIGVLSTPTVERTTFIDCTGETFLLERRRALLERLP